MNLTDIQKQLLENFKDVQTMEPWYEDANPKWYLNEECGLLRYTGLENKLSITRAFLRPHLLDLRDKGLIELVPAVDADGFPSGSGYILTDAGVALINKLFPLV